jgi:hypothetical protein
MLAGLFFLAFSCLLSQLCYDHENNQQNTAPDHASFKPGVCIQTGYMHFPSGRVYRTHKGATCRGTLTLHKEQPQKKTADVELFLAHLTSR